VSGVGFDSASAANLVVGLNEMLLHQFADAGAGASFWAQSTSMQSEDRAAPSCSTPRH
jgi:hypothetical protein